jgi:hypothetical protein
MQQEACRREGLNRRKAAQDSARASHSYNTVQAAGSALVSSININAVTAQLKTLCQASGCYWKLQKEC